MPCFDNRPAEELVLEIQNGNGELLPVLWDKTHDFIALKANDYILGFPENQHDLTEDCINEAYFGFIRAIKSYNPDKGCSFLGWLYICIRDDFTNAIYSGRSERHKKEPINNHISLDSPLTNNPDNEITLLETLVDKKSASYYRNYENKVFWNDLRKMLHNAISKCSSIQGRTVLKYMLEYDCGMKEAVRNCYELEQDKAYREAVKTKKELKQYLSRRDIRQKLIDIGAEEYILYKATGVKAYEYRNFTSTTEWGALKRIEDKRYLESDIVEILNK